MKKYLIFAALLSVVAVFASCQKEKEFIKTEGITISEATLSLIEGTSSSLTVSFAPANCTSKYLTWSSSDAQVASVDNFGKVVALHEGTAEISATSASGHYEVTCSVTVEPKTLFTSDDAGTRTVKAGAGEVTKDFLTYKDESLSWTENTTGAKREATITLPTGLEFTVTQVSAKDILPKMVGNWTLYNKRFYYDSPGKYKSQIASCKTPVTLNDQPHITAERTGHAGDKHTNNVGIRGIYLDTVLDGCLEIDYKTREVKFGLFFDSRDLQQTESTPYGNYAAYLPECATSNGWANYNFCPTADKAFSDTNCDWLWMTLSEDFSSFTHVYYGNTLKIGNGTYYVCGITIGTATSTDPSTYCAGGQYPYIFQCNYGGSNTIGLKFEKVTE